jgi:hypothetical protein
LWCLASLVTISGSKPVQQHALHHQRMHVYNHMSNDAAACCAHGVVLRLLLSPASQISLRVPLLGEYASVFMITKWYEWRGRGEPSL